jgi:hypothetical protein
LISQHLILLRDSIPGDEILFKQTLDENDQIVGAEFWTSEEPDRIKIEIVDIIGQNFNFKSDITESNYMIHINDQGE